MGQEGGGESVSWDTATNGSDGTAGTAGCVIIEWDSTIDIAASSTSARRRRMRY
jgi:hypothetical protein